ncbi:MAG: hypothetical protein AB7G12_06085 [Thermoanaerobaculia bacterium]
MKRSRPSLSFLSLVVASALVGCSDPNSGVAAGEAGVSAAKAPAETAPIQPWSYPPPVSGRISEANAGTFDLVDGIAYPASDASKGTVVFVTSKAIASPLLATTTCPATKARALKLLRNAHYVELTIDSRGHAPTFLYGSPYDGQGRGFDTGNSEWQSTLAIADGIAKGTVRHRYYGSFDYAVPVARTLPTEVSEDDRMAAGYAAWGGDAPVPTDVEAITAYGLTYRAVVDGDLGRYLELQGFTADEIAKIRGLAGIDDDFRAHRDRFLDPGAPEEPTLANGFAAIGARGTNTKGEAFANYYEFTPCGGALVLTSIALNPQ